MATKSLNKQIFRLAGGLVLLSTLAILVNVWFSTVDHAKKQLENNLQIAESVFKKIFITREEQLYNSADILTSDFGFKTAVSSDDEATIESALLNHGNRVNADLMAQLTLQGTVISTTNDKLKVGSQFPNQGLIEQTNQQGGASTIMVLNEQLYQVIFLTVQAPRPYGITLIGFEVNLGLLDQLKSITQLDVTIAIERNGDIEHSTSTQDPSFKNLSLSEAEAEVSWLKMLLFSDATYISKRFLYSNDNNNQIWVTLSENVARLFGEFNRLLLRISVIAGLSLILSLLFGAMFAKKLSKPLHLLSNYAGKISAGNYDQSVNVDSNSAEIEELSEAFQAMQLNIKERQSQIEYHATHDLLTGLYNRYKISQVLDETFNLQRNFMVVAANIHGFRGINDIFGYHNGDICLKVIGDRFKELGGSCARLNGGEFLWLPDNDLSHDQLREVQQKIELPVIANDVVMKFKLAIGVLDCPRDCTDSESVFKRTNISLDEARHAPGLLVEYAADFEKSYLRRLAIIAELKKVLDSHQSELSINYQPQLNLVTGKIEHAEALIRWNSATLGFVPPDEFISIAEQAGLIGQVTEWVINAVINDIAVMQHSGVYVSVAINLSAKDILNPNLLPLITHKLRQHNLPNNCLSFEITESDLVADQAKAVIELLKFREAGFSLAIDDFGTGYSSLAYLKSLPVLELKIDKSFILKLHKQQSDQQIVQTILQLAKGFNLSVVAEGIEDVESLQLLHEWGCQLAQGYYICKPIPLQPMIDWYLENKEKNWIK